MTQTQGSFLLWPKHLQENGQKFEVDKKVCALSLKLNKKILTYFVGFSTKYKQIGHKTYLLNLLSVLSDFWDVFWQKGATNEKKNMNVTANVVCISWCKRLEPSDLFKRVGLRLLWSLRSWQGTLMVWNPCWSIMPVPGFYIMQIEHLECCRVVCRNKQHCVIPNPLFEKLEYGMCMVQWELEDRNCDAWNIYFFHGDCIVGCVF